MSPAFGEGDRRSFMARVVAGNKRRQASLWASFKRPRKTDVPSPHFRVTFAAPTPYEPERAKQAKQIEKARERLLGMGASPEQIAQEIHHNEEVTA